MVQRYMSVAAAEARKKRRHEAAERHQRVAAKGAEEQIEPRNVRL
jgi:hypothetical protein